MDQYPKLTLKQTEPSELVDAFTNFYCDFISNLYDVKCAEFLRDVKRALKDMRQLKHDINKRHEIDFRIDTNYEKSAVRCAYLYSYGVLNTAIVYSEFLKHLKGSDMITPDLFSRKTLKICCLAGGPGTEGVAVSKAICDFMSKSSSEVDICTDVEVTVVDIISEWKDEGETLISALNKSDLFNSKRIVFHYIFLKADLLSPLDETLKKKIAESNIITVVKFGSSIAEKNVSVCVLENLIQNVINCMDKNSCLFMLDLAGGNIFRRTMHAVQKQPNNYRREHKKYRLMPKTMQKMESCIDFRKIGKGLVILPTVLTTISSCFWIKKQENPPKKKNNDLKTKSKSVKSS